MKMATMAEVKAAEKVMRDAYDALMQYVERPEAQPTDIKLHLRLADELRQANNNYVKLLSELE